MRKRRENCRKKVPELFGSCLEKSLSLHPLRERNTARKRQKQVLKNFEKISEIKCPQSRSFIVTIVERKAIDLYRAKQRNAVVPFEEEYINVPSVSEADAAVQRTNLAKAMATLPTRYRELLFLKYDNGYSEREIAVMCSMTEANVKKTVQRAKKKLESILNGQEA